MASHEERWRRAPAILTALLLGCAILCSPGLVSLVIRLRWRNGNITPTLHILQALLVLLATVTFVARARVGRLWRRLFPSRKELLFALVFAAVSFAFSLGVTEVVFRVMSFPFKPVAGPQEEPIGRFDPDLGWVYVPNHSFVQRVGTDRRAVTVDINDVGARVGHAGERFDAHAPSILFVGDSFTMGHGVPFEDSFVGVLASRPGFPYQAVDLGVQAYGTDQAFLMLQRQFARFRVKAVVYTFIALHMERNASDDPRELIPIGRFPGTKPRFGLSSDGELQLLDEPVAMADLRYSHVWAYLKTLWLQRGPHPTPDLTIALVQAMRHYAESRGAVFILIHWDLWDEGRRVWEAGSSPFRGIVPNLIETSIDAPPGWGSWVIPGDDHPDERAHRRVAQLLFDELVRLRLLAE